MASPIPRSSLFAFSVPVRPAGKTKIDGKLDDWMPHHLLPPVALESRSPFAGAWMAWAPKGLWFAFDVARTRAPRVLPNRLAEGDCIEIYLDTRDIRTAHRAGRYCHKLVVAPVGGPGRGRQPVFEHQDIARSLANPTRILSEQVEIASTVREDGYSIELFMPAETLTGYDVEVTRRLGLAYVIHDIERPMQVWPHEQELPVWVDPSLWATLELRDA